MDNIERKFLFARFDEEATGRFHEFYALFGARQSAPGRNFHCWNGAAHAHGDADPSLSIDNERGLYKCHACGIKGNFNTFYKEQVANGPFDKWGGSYIKCMMDLLNIADVSAGELDKAKIAYKKLTNRPVATSPVAAAPGPATNQKEKKTAVPQNPSINEGFVAELLNNEEKVKYLYNKRHITKEIIIKYGLGFSFQWDGFTFPMYNQKGELVNIKVYRPWMPKAKKWRCMFKDNPVAPSPLSSLTAQKIYLHEGEPDAYCSLAFGINGFTTGAAGGMKHIKEQFGNQFEKIFKGKEIIIVPDRDKTGIAAGMAAAASLHLIANLVKIINLDKSEKNPDGLDPTLLNDKGKRVEKDFTDFLQKNGMDETAKSKFLDLENITELWNPPSDCNEKEAKKKKLLPVEIAEDYLKARAYNIEDNYYLRYYNYHFVFFDGKVYQVLDDTDVEKDIYQFLQTYIQYRAYARPQIVKAIIENISALAYIPHNVEQPAWISDNKIAGQFVVVENGIVNITALIGKKREDEILLRHTRYFFSTVKLPFEYIPAATCPKFKEFIEKVLPDPKVRQLVLEFVASLFIPEFPHEHFLILIGEGANGKSVFLNITIALIGKDNVSSVPLESFSQTHTLANTLGKLANIAFEMGYIDKGIEGILKAYVSREPIMINQKYKPVYSARPTARLIFATNNAPQFSDRSSGIGRRLLMAEFNQTIPDEEQDKLLAEKIIKSELPGIFNLLMENLAAVLKRGRFEEPDACKKAKEALRTENDPVRLFLSTECEFDKDSLTNCSGLYASYVTYAQKTKQEIVKSTVFGKTLHKTFPFIERIQRREGDSSKWYYKGIKIIGDSQLCGTTYSFPEKVVTDVTNELDKIKNVYYALRKDT